MNHVVRSSHRPKCLMLDAAKIRPSHDAGSRAILDISQVLSEIGFDVEFLWENDPSFDDALASTDAKIAFVNRPSLFNRVYARVNNRIKTIYLAHDFHTLRLERELVLSNRLSSARVRAMRLLEQVAFEKCTLALLPTKVEADLVRETLGAKNVEQINYFFFTPTEISESIGKKLVFVGGQAHSPNADGVGWFITRVLPSLQSSFPDLEVVIIGSWLDDFRESASLLGVKFTGLIDEKTLSKTLASSTIGIAPLRFGAGVKRKVLDYLNHSLPVVSTSIGIEGITDLGSPPPGVLEAESEQEWISILSHLLESAERRQTLGSEGLKFIRSNYSREIMADRLRKLLESM
jgi:glycosyltransferase involved in cell wall biosynthesis